MPRGLRRTGKKGSVDITEPYKVQYCKYEYAGLYEKKSGKAAAYGELNEELTQKAPPGIE